MHHSPIVPPRPLAGGPSARSRLVRTILTTLAIASVGSLLAIPTIPGKALGSPPWGTYGQNPQHQALSRHAAAPLQRIKWSTPIDENPPYDEGGDLLIHYASPVITHGNTVVLTVKMAPADIGLPDRFRADGRKGGNGHLVWSMPTDWVAPPHNWFPSCSGTLVDENSYAIPASGGTVLVRENANAGSSGVQRAAFFGLDNYNSNKDWCDANVFVTTPLTGDRAGNLWFGYRVLGAVPGGFPAIGAGGIARISLDGHQSWFTTVADATGDGAITQVQTNCAPALSVNGGAVYIAMRNDSSYHGYLVKFDSHTLAPLAKALLKDPYSGNDARVLNDGTSSPMVGPDGDVYFGIFNNPYMDSHGWMSHFDGDLNPKAAIGAFGWDDTASLVPAALVRSYTGSSPYLILTKYNKYAGFYYPQIGQLSTGINLIAVLDPDTGGTVDNRTSLNVMTEVITVQGVTPDDFFRSIGWPDAVREWCINTAAIDPHTRCAIINSEDGILYRWDFDTNSLTEKITLAPPTGEAYTSTAIGPDGTVYAINNATFFAVGRSDDE